MNHPMLPAQIRARIPQARTTVAPAPVSLARPAALPARPPPKPIAPALAVKRITSPASAAAHPPVLTAAANASPFAHMAPSPLAVRTAPVAAPVAFKPAALGAKPATSTLHQKALEPVAKPAPAVKPASAAKPAPVAKSVPVKPFTTKKSVVKPVAVVSSNTQAGLQLLLSKYTPAEVTQMIAQVTASQGVPLPANVAAGLHSLAQNLKASPKAAPRAKTVGGLGTLGLSSEAQSLLIKTGSEGVGLGAGALIGTAAGTAGGVAFGAAAGSVVPVIGTAIGAAVGFLASKLFGHANYQQIANDVAGQMNAAEQWKQLAGKYPGRAYGVKALQAVWEGLTHEGFFNLNKSNGTCPVSQCIASPSPGNCPNCGGIQQWADDLFTQHVANPGSRSPLGAAKQAIASGLTSIQAADQILIPNWSHGTGVWIPWIYPANTQNATLARQLIIDTIDAYMAQLNPNLPIWYGQGTTATASTSSAGAPVTSTTGVPLTSTTGIPATSTTGLPVTSTGVTSTGVALTQPIDTSTPSGLTTAIQQLLAQGATQQQAYQAIATQLQQQGAQLTAAQQQSLAGTIGQVASSGSYPSAGSSAVPTSAPTGTTGAITAGTTTTGTMTLGIVLIGAIGVGAVMFALKDKHKSKPMKAAA